MPTIAWKSVYETGIVALDNEHKQLIDQINRLYEAVRDKRGDEVLDDILEMLQDYTENHFQHEEKLMAEYDYPGLPEHRKAHQDLRDTVKLLSVRDSSGAQGLANELMKLMRGWVLEHIVEVDKKYGAYLESRGGRFIA
jgi:hemerythrin